MLKKVTFLASLSRYHQILTYICESWRYIEEGCFYPYILMQPKSLRTLDFGETLTKTKMVPHFEVLLRHNQIDKLHFLLCIYLRSIVNCIIMSC